MSINSPNTQPTHPAPTQPAHQPPRGPWWRRLAQWQIVALLLILIGVALMALYSLRSVRSYREFQYIRAEGLDRGTARVEAIRPWMTVRYVAVAYAVPEEYIFAELEIPYNRRNRNETLGRLNEEYAMGQSTLAPYPQIIDRVAQAIRDYRANPVPTGLRELRPWMTLRYIAVSTGVPEAILLAALELDVVRAAEIDATVRPLDELAHELRYPGGPEELFRRLRAAIDAYEVSAP